MTTVSCHALFACSVCLVTLLTLVQTSPAQTRDDVHALLDSTDLSDTAAVNRLFQTWGNKHGKNYASNAHQQQALQNLVTNAKKVKANRQAGNSAYVLSLNKFADKSFDDIRKTRLGFVKSRANNRNTAAANTRVTRQTLPVSVNWTALNYVTPVQDQGDCGCCWAFASA
jgi:C1A family cysteine protease